MATTTLKQLRDEIERLRIELREAHDIIRSDTIAREAYRYRTALERIAMDDVPDDHGRWHVDIAREALREDVSQQRGGA